ncbi:recombinase family protein [Amycolatopsis thermoflava]|uniref:recombinase family protein n=1 Tax=Amycolatopsis thermoflava TaxID=84480 RepID=UPI000411E447|nr:recombinase family protein [Amycolatopsis thermoflava]
MTRALIYCHAATRVVTDRRGSVAGQEEECRQLAAELGWQVVGVYRDVSYPRAQYEDLLNDLRAGKGDVVLAFSHDQLHGNLVDLHALAEIRTVQPVNAGVEVPREDDQPRD